MDQDAFRAQWSVDPRAAVDLPVLIVDRLDLHGQGTVNRPPRRLSAIAPAEVALHGNLEDPAHDVEVPQGTVRFDEALFHRRSSRRIRFPRSRAARRASIAVRTPLPRKASGPSVSALLAQDRSNNSLKPRSAATWRKLIPGRLARVTAWVLNSLVEVFRTLGSAWWLVGGHGGHPMSGFPLIRRSIKPGENHNTLAGEHHPTSADVQSSWPPAGPGFRPVWRPRPWPRRFPGG